MKYLSFRQKLLLIGVIPVMILGVLIGYLSFNDAKNIVTNAQREVIADTVYRIDVNLNMKVRYISESIRSAAENRLAGDLIENYYNGTESPQIISEMESYCEGITRAFDAISSISVISGTKVLFTTRGEDKPIINRTIVDGLYRKAVEKPEKIFWSNLDTSMFLDSQNDGSKMLTAYGSIRDEEGNVIGLLVVELLPGSFSSLLLENQKILSYQYTYIVDKNEQVICADRNGYPSFYKMIEEKFDTGTRRFQFEWNGEKYYACGQYNGLTGWKTFSVISIKNLFAESDSLKTHITWLVIGAVFFMMLAILMMYNSITRPLNDLSKAMKTVQDGNFELQLDNDRKDEIGQLTESFNYMVNKINLLIREVYQEKLAQKSAEIEALQAQINPHFLYNTLDSINWMLIDRGEMDISDIIVSLGKLMQYCIDTDNALVTLEQEYQYIQDYLCIQKNRLEERLQYTLEIEQPLKELLVPKLILQPLVENSIKHAIEPFKKQGLITIRSYLSDGKINVSVQDNGCGMSSEQLLELHQSDKRSGGQTGIGVKNVERRLKLFFGDDSELRIDSEQDVGTKMTIVIPTAD